MKGHSRGGAVSSERIQACIKHSLSFYLNYFSELFEVLIIQILVSLFHTPFWTSSPESVVQIEFSDIQSTLNIHSLQRAFGQLLLWKHIRSQVQSSENLIMLITS